ncbi:MAG: hypothetical protein M1822_008870 [Bathelium mastoideum]|nr:MAG: hypothetical protein M1822_008870 [Bathelium mastoideum]
MAKVGENCHASQWTVEPPNYQFTVLTKARSESRMKARRKLLQAQIQVCQLIGLEKQQNDLISKAPSQQPLEHSPMHAKPARNIVAQSNKRRPDGACEKNLLPSKKARLTHSGTLQLKKETPVEPKPNHPKNEFGLFSGELAEYLHKEHCPSINESISEWLESVESEREVRCRTDRPILPSESDPVSGNCASLTSGMEYQFDNQGFAIPQDAASQPKSVIPSGTTGSRRSSGRNLVEDPLYRSTHLNPNRIHMRYPNEEFPEHITSLIDKVRKERNSPPPSQDQLRNDRELHDLELLGGEPEVETHFRNRVFPRPGLMQNLSDSVRTPLFRNVIPNSYPTRKVSNPVPDLIYGYGRNIFTDAQKMQLLEMGDTASANSRDLIYPFFVIEFKGDGPSGSGGLWVATNQCLRGSASCVNIAERLNSQLKRCENKKIHQVNSSAFNIAMHGTEARLYVSWKHNELDYYMRKVTSFLLQKPEDYLEFRKYVRNIIDWGKDERLKEIRDALNSVLEEGTRRASEAARSRPLSSHSSVSISKRGKSA